MLNLNDRRGPFWDLCASQLNVRHSPVATKSGRSAPGPIGIAQGP